MRKISFCITLIVISNVLLLSGCRSSQTQYELEESFLQKHPDYDPNTIVLLVHIAEGRNGVYISLPRVSFAVGDGTTIVTAAHCVKRPTNWPQGEKLSSEILAISPYYGDAFKCELAALDEKADMAILKAPWEKHPALKIASPNDLDLTESLIVFSRPTYMTKQRDEYARRIRVAAMDIDDINHSEDKKGITFKQARPIKPGWSGSPIVIPGTAEVAGVMSHVSGLRLRIPLILELLLAFNAAGPNVEPLWNMLENNELQDNAKIEFPDKLISESKSELAFDSFLDYIAFFSKSDIDKANEAMDELLEIHSDSTYGNLFKAFCLTSMAEKTDVNPLEFSNQTENFYKKAIASDADSVLLRTLYTSFLLSHNFYDKALEQAEKAIAIEPNDYVANMSYMAAISKVEPDNAEQFGLTQIEKYPEDSDYQYFYGIALFELEKYEQALEAIEKAIKMNKDGEYFGGLADIYEKLGQLKKAESNYKKMTKVCGCQRCWYKYAKFLTEHRPEKSDKAQEAFEQVKKKEYMLRVSDEEMDELESLLQKNTKK